MKNADNIIHTLTSFDATAHTNRDIEIRLTALSTAPRHSRVS